MFTKKVQIEEIFKINVPKAILYISENNLFALTPQENYWFDITNKRSPQLISNFSLNRADYINSLVGVVNKKGYFSIGYSGLEVVDFQNEKNPQSLGFIKDIGIGSKTKFYESQYLITNLKKPTVYRITSPTEFSEVFQFSDGMFDFLILKNYLCAMLLNEGIRIYDIVEPTYPRLVFSLNINIVKLLTNNSGTILVQGADDAIYVLDVSNLPNITIIAKIKIPGPIAADSLICKDDFLFVRFMRKMVGDTTWAFNIRNPKKPKKLLSFNSKGMPLYTANDKVLVFMGIKDWDGVSAISKYTTSFYKVFRVRRDKVTHIDDIELDGVWFSSILLLDSVIYIARTDGIYVYELKE